MKRDELSDLAAFVAVADTQSFTRAAAQRSMSPSALSHAMRTLETRLGVRLLARTTRSVAPTEAGERLLRTIRPALQDISAELAALGNLRDKPAGNLRLTMPKHAAQAVLMPMLPGFLAAYPDIRAEITVDEGLTDIVASRYDAGLRFGENIAGDMIAVRVGPSIRSTVIATPSYFAAHPPPVTPHDLARHECINYRLKTAGSLYAWEFEKAGQSLQVRVDGKLIFSDSDLILAAALAGQGVAQLFEDQVGGHVASGRLMPVLIDWSWTAPGYYLYHTSRRQTPPALAALIAALRAPAAQQPNAER
jgi:DNA-binding transcriptional LysR family regulator